MTGPPWIESRLNLLLYISSMAFSGRSQRAENVARRLMGKLTGHGLPQAWLIPSMALLIHLQPPPSSLASIYLFVEYGLSNNSASIVPSGVVFS